jgi:hypothetical protein
MPTAVSMRRLNGSGRPDLADRQDDARLEFDDDSPLRTELVETLAQATVEEWLERSGVGPAGGPVGDVSAIQKADHCASRGIVEGTAGAWPYVTAAIR